MAWVAYVVEAVAMAYSAYEGAQAAKENKKAMEELKASTVPSPISETAVDEQKSKAEDTITQQRRTLLASGGETNITGGSANILGSNVASKTLLGA